MVTSKTRWDSPTTDTFRELARQFKRIAALNASSIEGVDAEASKFFSWTTLSDDSDTEGVVLWVGELPAVLLRIEPDIFNSNCMTFPQANLHWLRNPLLNCSTETINELSVSLRGLLEQSRWKLISMRLLGVDPIASELFQRAGFRLIVGNAWFFRKSDFPLPRRELPSNVEFELIDLEESPFTGDKLQKALAIAKESPIVDRFTLDRRISSESVNRRFLQIVANGLSGNIANHVAVASVRSHMQTLVFFDVSKMESDNDEAVAGKWLTAITRSSGDVKGLSYSLIAESMHLLAAQRTHWTVSCSLSNFRSMGGLYKLLFRLGAIAYDLHWWAR